MTTGTVPFFCLPFWITDSMLMLCRAKIPAMVEIPLFDIKDPAGILMEINACRKTFPNHYVRVTAFDSTQGVESPRMSYIVNRPPNEPGFGLVRQEIDGRQIRYSITSYAADKPEGDRY